jgi:hypothetical protein
MIKLGDDLVKNFLWKMEDCWLLHAFPWAEVRHVVEKSEFKKRKKTEGGGLSGGRGLFRGRTSVVGLVRHEGCISSFGNQEQCFHPKWLLDWRPFNRKVTWRQTPIPGHRSSR